jgi:hypothetical protein
MAVHFGVFHSLFGNSRNAPPSNEDIARVGVAALIDPSRHAGKRYRPTGPELLGAEDMAKAIGRAIGRSVKAVPTPVWLFMKAARLFGMPIDTASNIRYYIDDHKRGAFELGAPTTDVLDVTGRPPEDFETIARRYATAPHLRSNLLDEERDAAGALADPFDNVPRQRMMGREFSNHLRDLHAIERRQGDHAMMRPHAPGRAELRPRRRDDEQRGLRPALGQRAHEIERSRVGPV